MKAALLILSMFFVSSSFIAQGQEQFTRNDSVFNVKCSTYYTLPPRTECDTAFLWVNPESGTTSEESKIDTQWVLVLVCDTAKQIFIPPYNVKGGKFNGYKRVKGHTIPAMNVPDFDVFWQYSWAVISRTGIFYNAKYYLHDWNPIPDTWIVWQTRTIKKEVQ